LPAGATQSDVVAVQCLKTSCVADGGTTQTNGTTKALFEDYRS